VNRAGALARRPLQALPLWAVVAAAVAVFVPVGLVGTARYLNNFWLYRGYPPPKDPSFVTQPGTTQAIAVASPALGGRRQQVIVYLPSGYASQPGRRYPVFYLLHGFPGRPAAFLLTVRAGVVEDILLAKKRIRPFILVMPWGSTGTFTDKEWANGVKPGSGWETFVARDLVRAIDGRYRTIPTSRGRVLGGLSEGGYGALNIGLHHPGTFRVLESWSGYELADKVRSIFGGDPSRLALNSPLDQLPRRAAALRRDGTFIWFYSGRNDRLRHQNAAFAAELARMGIGHRYFVVRGGHDWSLWRGNAALALLAASKHLGHA
jgi:enterochelin esterase-like enzyme